MADPSSWLRRFKIYDPTPVTYPISPEQIRQGRKQLRWSRDRLAAKADVPVGFVIKYERDGNPGAVYSRERGFDALTAIRTVLIEAGVDVDGFTSNP